MVSPSALAVLRLMASVNLVGSLDGQIARFRTLEDAIDVACRLSIIVNAY